MKTLIIYKSRHGATKKYAEWLKNEISNADLINLDEIKPDSLNNYDTVIVGSCIYAGKLFALDFLVQNWETLKNKNIFFFSVGMTDPNDPSSIQTFETIPTFIREKIQYKKLPGELDIKNMNVFEKLITKIVKQPVYEGGVKEENLQPILQFVKNL